MYKEYKSHDKNLDGLHICEIYVQQVVDSHSF